MVSKPCLVDHLENERFLSGLSKEKFEETEFDKSRNTSDIT